MDKQMNEDRNITLNCAVFCDTNIALAKIIDTTPTAYRLKRLKNGELTLQGCFIWRQGWETGGVNGAIFQP